MTFCTFPEPVPHSLADNQLCGLTRLGRGTYTAKGVDKLCEGLKNSSITNLKCAASPYSQLFSAL